MKSCNVYSDSDFIYVIGSVETTLGFNLAAEPMIKLARDVPLTTLGTAVQQALSAHRKGVSPPKDLATVDRLLLGFLGYKSWRKFEREAQCALVQLQARTVKVIPTRIGGDGGFLFLPEHAVNVNCEPAEIGAAVAHALARRLSL